MRVSEEPVYIYLFRQFTVFTSLHLLRLRSPVHGWKRNYVPNKFSGIDSEWIPRKKVLIPRSTEEPIPKLGTDRVTGLKRKK